MAETPPGPRAGQGADHGRLSQRGGLRIGLIGCGAVARLHAERLREDGRAEIAVFCDPHPAAAAALAGQFNPGAAIETDPARAMRTQGLKAVIIASPTPEHYHQVCLALDAGLDVLCEKPLSERREQIADLIARRDRLGRVLGVAYQRRYKSPYLTARRELAERADWYGTLKQVHIFVCERWQQTIHGTWRDDARVGAGYFGDAGSHQIDVMHFITGQRPEAVLAHSDRRGSQVEIVTHALARLSGGAAVSAHFVGDANHWREDIHFHCSQADLLLRSEQLLRARRNQVEAITDLVPGSSPDAALVDAVLRRRTIASPAEDSLAMHDWTEAVLSSARQGCWVSLPA